MRQPGTGGSLSTENRAGTGHPQFVLRTGQPEEATRPWEGWEV